MTSYKQRILETLREISVNKHGTLEEMIQEWKWNGEVYDFADDPRGSYGQIAYGKCQLCGHEDIRWGFTIINQLSGNIFPLVGSGCIEQFTWGSQQEMTKAIQKYTKKRNPERVLHILSMVKDLDLQFETEGFINYYQERGKFTPSQTNLLFHKFRHYKIPFDEDWFKVSMKRGRERRQFTKAVFENIKGALTPTQVALIRREWTSEN
jgi:hypothetical protein